MKKLSNSFLLFLALCFCWSSASAQWNGSSGSTGNIYRSGNVCIGSSTSPEQLLTLSADNKPVLRFERTGSNRWDYEIYATGGGHLRFRGGAHGTGDALQDNMVIRGTGKVSIGTLNAPETIGSINIEKFRLFVAGGMLTDEVIVRTNWADYVFEKDYELKPLSEVAKHIEEKGYLHNTPSAAEIESNGLNVGDVTVNQQEKIEELFLHMIAMEKRLEGLEKENATLKAQLANERD
ncbi:MAG: hypothetical protein AAF985_26420 [Bacteroidota bacterium]